MGGGIRKTRSGDKWIHLCEIWHMSAPGLLWVLSELFGAKLGAVGRLTNQRWGRTPVVSLVEKLPRTSPNLVVGQTDGYGGGTPPLHHLSGRQRRIFPGKHKMRRWQSWIIWVWDTKFKWVPWKISGKFPGSPLKAKLHFHQSTEATHIALLKKGNGLSNFVKGGDHKGVF